MVFNIKNKHKKQKRGFACVGLDRPKCASNIGGVLRAAGCYGADLIVVSGNRYNKSKVDTQKAHKHIPMLESADLKSMIPKDCVPVTVDLVDGAENLCDFEHPERAFYIFGSEDGTLDDKILSFCQRKVYVPTSHCMNLAATANVVLYDRMVKRKEYV